MAFAQKLNCSWSLGASIASIIALVTVVHLFFFPLVPSLDNLRRFPNSGFAVNSSTETYNNHVKQDPGRAIDLNRKFPPDSHDAVVYHGAPWKSHIGRWLSGCDANAKELQIVEVVRNSETFLSVIHPIACVRVGFVSLFDSILFSITDDRQ